MANDPRFPWSYVNEDGQPQLRNSVVAFIDMLGYVGMVEDAQRTGRSEALLRSLREVLNTGYDYLRRSAYDDWLDTDWFAIRTFTDNVVVGYPIMEDGEFELGFVYRDLSYFQLIMSKAGFFIRGAIAVGPAYLDDDIVYGAALLEAYKAERTIARDPRIVLAPSARELTQAHIEYYRDAEGSPQFHELFVDADGQWFLNYLDSLMIAEHEGGPDVEGLLAHKAAVEEKLFDFHSTPSIWNKYAWVANYHNYFCQQHPDFNEGHEIDAAAFSSSPRRIIEDQH